jgi:hypothetical protein
MALALFGTTFGLLFSANLIIKTNELLKPKKLDYLYLPFILALGTGSSLVLFNNLAKKLKLTTISDYNIDFNIWFIQVYSCVATVCIGLMHIVGKYI